MSTPKQQPISPLRDRLLSNSPTADPVKSSILRESGLGWNSSPPPSGTSPLRISKRDSSPQRSKHQHPSQIARRSSSTYKRLGNNNLVSKSPFKSQIPTPTSKAPTAPTPKSAPVSFPSPSPRKVSGEKRPRPQSMQEQAETENERPFAYKRERRQSKGYQGLIQKEPVTKSPFRQSISHPGSGSQLPLPSLPPVPTQNKDSREGSPSPTRSSLVSRRLHGPRFSGAGAEGKRQRRKTVTFDEQCDVVEFDVEECEEDPFIDDDDDDMEMDEIDMEDMQADDVQHQGEQPSYHTGVEHEHERDGQGTEDSFESVALGEADDSITGMVNSMLNNTSAHITDISTPPLTPSLPADLSTDAEDGVPHGRSHHFDRIRQNHARSPPLPASPQQRYPFHSPSLANGNPATPPRSNRRFTSPLIRLSPGSRIPLGRSTHIERVKAERKAEDEIKEDVDQLPPSPSPVKNTSSTTLSPRDGLVPKFDLQVNSKSSPKEEKGNDPFALAGGGMHRLELSFTSHDESDSDSRAIDPVNISIGHSEVSLSGLEIELGLGDDNSKPVELQAEADARPLTPSTESDSSYSSQSTTQESSSSTENFLPPINTAAAQSSPRVCDPTSPTQQLQVSSPPRRDVELASSVERSDSVNGRVPRINREDVQRRLMKKSLESPAPDVKVGSTAEEIPEEEDVKRISVLTDFDMSTEVATIETVTEKRHVGLANVAVSVDTQPQPRAQAIALPQAVGEGLLFDMGQFGMGSVDVDMKSALDRLMDDVAGSATADGAGAFEAKEHSGPLAVEAVTEDVKAGRFEVDDSMRTETEEDEPLNRAIGKGRPPITRAATEPEFFVGPGSISPTASRTASGSTIPPPPPPKDAIRSREELIIEKRREARRREENENGGYWTPPRHSAAALGIGRPSRRRSRSTGDMDELVRRNEKKGNQAGFLDVGGLVGKTGDDLGHSIQRELRKLEGGQSTYHVKEQATIYASSDVNIVSHMESAGDVNAGKAWRPVRRPSDMNEYSKQIKEYRAQEKPGKAHGKVFVRVLAMKGINVPLPQQTTVVTCTLNNGIHFVTTPECRFSRDSRIDQEFELIEHSKLEFTLTLKIRRDPHIITMFKAMVPTPPQPLPTASASRSGMRAFFSSPKKSTKPVPRPAAPAPLQENLARYLKPDGTLARAFISFKDIAARCDTKLFETSYPLIGQRIEAGGAMSTLRVGELVLQIFRLPPLPGVSPDQLPQSLDECHRGLRHNNWHKMTYFEGTLTQQGGDCMTWRRRQLRVIGANLVAFNDVTKKATATIGLKKALAVEDDQPDILSPTSGLTARSSRYADDYDGLGGVERSFRLIFPNNEEIVFFADTDEEKAKWLEVFRALVGHIPPNPLWAELVWQRQEELKKQAAAAQPSRAALPASSRTQEALSRSQQR